MRPKPVEKRIARAMRREGKKLRHIAAELSVSVNSVSRWTGDITLTPEQIEANRAGPRQGSSCDPASVARRGSTWSELNRERRRGYQDEGREVARGNDALHQAGCMLYWAEGSKGRNTLALANSDQQMVAFFVRFLRESMCIADERMRLTLNVYTGNGLSILQIEDSWLDLLGLPRSCFRKHQVDNRPTSSSGKKRNRLPHGVCTIAVGRSTRELQHIYGAIQEYGGFDEPIWLEGLYT